PRPNQPSRRAKTPSKTCVTRANQRLTIMGVSQLRAGVDGESAPGIPVAKSPHGWSGWKARPTASTVFRVAEAIGHARLLEAIASSGQGKHGCSSQRFRRDARVEGRYFS